MGASFVARRKWASLQATMRHNPGNGPHNELNELVDSVGNDFYFHVLSLLASRGTSAKVQLFHLSLVMRHKGLSRSGLQLLSSMNLGLAPRTFDPELKALVARQTERHRFTSQRLIVLHSCVAQATSKG